MTSQDNTDWALSASGNWWRQVNGTALIVGKTQAGRIWARVGDNFLDGQFNTLTEAQATCERAVGIMATTNNQLEKRPNENSVLRIVETPIGSAPWKSWADPTVGHELKDNIRTQKKNGQLPNSSPPSLFEWIAQNDSSSALYKALDYFVPLRPIIGQDGNPAHWCNLQPLENKCRVGILLLKDNWKKLHVFGTNKLERPPRAAITKQPVTLISLNTPINHANLNTTLLAILDECAPDNEDEIRLAENASDVYRLTAIYIVVVEPGEVPSPLFYCTEAFLDDSSQSHEAHAVYGEVPI